MAKQAPSGWQNFQGIENLILYDRELLDVDILQISIDV